MADDMDDFEGLLDMEDDLELGENLELLDELNEHGDDEGERGRKSKRPRLGVGSDPGLGLPPVSASLGLTCTQELEHLVNKAPSQSQPVESFLPEDTHHITETELQELAAHTSASQQPPTQEEEEEEQEEEEERLRPVQYLHQTEGHEYMTVTLQGGKRVYCPLPKESGDDANNNNNNSSSNNNKKKRTESLLAEPVKRILERVERKRVQRILEESENLSRQLETNKDCETTNKDPHQQPDPMAGERLLVAKYAPKRFIELLSDEKTNREVVRWLKLWDHYVFGAPRKANNHGSAGESSSHQQQQPFPSRKDWLKADNTNRNNNRRSNMYQTKDTLEGDGRPTQKVLLFCGPPGFGKTTLAHVAARQCGYRTVEINASDDRNASAINTRIMDAMQMQSMKDKRPTCLIIDEIDGAMGGAEGKSAIGMLTQLITATRKAANASGEGGGNATTSEGGAKRKRKKGKVQIVTRPIICICNDLYANTLRPLRDVARIFHFKKPDARKIGTRLRRICQIEKIEVESNALNVLCQRSDGDVRTCLNSLEFLQKSQKKLSMASLVGMGIGGKDKTNNVFNVMESVFNSDNKEHLGGRSGAAATTPRSPGSGPSRRQQLVTHLFEKIMNFGETDLLLSSCFENLLKVKFRDIDLSKTTQASEWFVFADELSSRIADSQEYSLNTYRAAVPIALRFLASAPAKPQLSYPKMESQANAKQRIHQSTLHTWMSNLMPLAKTGMNGTTAVMDVIPALCASLVPKGLRPVAPELMRSNERVTLKRVVDHMVSYGLGLKINNDMMMSNGSFHGSFMPQTTYCLQPEIDKFHRYSSSKSGHGISMKGEVKQIISYELESRKIRSTRDLGVKQTLHDKVKKKSKEKEALLVQKSNNWLTRMGAHVEKAQEQKRLGWAAGQGGTICRKRVFPMLYTYHEGVTNAVKRRLTLQEII